jgi:hypothetical protein
MVVELYNGTKPASETRARILSIILLTLACVLAATMSWSRCRQPLAGKIEPPNWRISFRPPKRFTQGELVQTSFAEVIVLFGVTNHGAEARLAILRLHPSVADDPETLCAELVRQYAFVPPRKELSPVPGHTSAKLGPFDAVQTMAPSRSAVARVTLPATGVGYAVALTVDGEPIDDDLYHLFDLTCGSIESITP